MPKEPRKKPLSPKELAAIREEKEKAREVSPQERRRRMVINFGVGILLLAFISTSGITCVNWGAYSKTAKQAEQASGKSDPVAAEIDRWQKEVEAKPTDYSALANLAFFLIEKGDRQVGKKDEAQKTYGEAAQKLEAALKLNPDYSFALRLMAKIRTRQEKYDEAKAQYEAALKVAQKPVDPKDPEKEAKETNAKADQSQAHMGLADLAMRTKDTKAALLQLDEVIKLDPGNMEAYSGRAEIHMEEKQPELARKDLDTVMKIAQAMPPSASSYQAAQRAQMMLYMMDQSAGITPTPSASPRVIPGSTVTPDHPKTPAPATSATPTGATPQPAPPATPAASATPAVSPTP